MVAIPDRLPDRLTEAAYVVVGFAVLGFQRAQVRRRELERAVRETLRTTATDSRGAGRGGAAPPGSAG